MGAIAFACAPAMAVEAGPKAVKKPAKKAKAPVQSPALDKRVEGAPTIFVGEGMRIYFVDRRYQEVPYIRALGEGAHKSAMIVVKVVKVLHPANTEAPTRVLVPIETSRDVFGEGRSPYDELAERHVGKQGIWFGEIVVRTDYGDDRSGRRPLEEPVTLLQSWDSKRKPVANSVPIKQLKEVEASINRVKLGKQDLAKDDGAVAQPAKSNLETK